VNADITGESTIDRDPGTLHAKAWAEEYELIDRQLSPLGLAAMQMISRARWSVPLRAAHPWTIY